MKNGIFCLLSVVSVFFGCNKVVRMDAAKEEIRQAEKAFEAAVKEKGIAQGFYLFADDSAIIKRAKDTLIRGKENIRNFYKSMDGKNIEVTWSPDFVNVSSDGSLGYTFGKYLWRMNGDSGQVSESRGVFHTVWKRQSDGSWKYVWD
jgi:ketosteroid isomerase-like protein